MMLDAVVVRYARLVVTRHTMGVWSVWIVRRDFINPSLVVPSAKHVSPVHTIHSLVNMSACCVHPVEHNHTQVPFSVRIVHRAIMHPTVDEWSVWNVRRVDSLMLPSNRHVSYVRLEGLAIGQVRVVVWIAQVDDSPILRDRRHVSIVASARTIHPLDRVYVHCAVLLLIHR